MGAVVTRVGLVGLTVMAVMLGGTAAAHAKKPAVSLTIPDANAGAPMTASYTTKRVRPKHRLVIQRQQGTKRVWKTVASLPHVGSGTAQLPSLALGAYNFRIAAVGARRKVLAQKQAAVRVYGQVPLSTLTGWVEYVFTAPSHTFRYVQNGYGYGTVFTASKNPCRSVHIDFIGGFYNDGQGDYAPAAATIVQETLDPVTATAGYDTIGALDATLVPGRSWSLILGPREHSPSVYANGFASCFRAKNLRY